MKVVITSATEGEVLQIKQTLIPRYTEDSSSLKVTFHTSGVGMLVSCFSLTKMIFEQKPGLVIQVGIAGTFNENMPLSKVVAVENEFLADTGVEENREFKDVFDLNLIKRSTFPFENGSLINRSIHQLNILQLDEVTGVTINEISTRRERIQQLKAKYRPTIESMEGAALHYCCLQTSTPFIQIRSISNYIGERDKSKWDFKRSFANLATEVTRYIDKLYTLK